MRTVPLHGNKAAGRVVRVDDEKYDLVMHYRWYVKEVAPRKGNRGIGPYALAVFENDPLGRIAPDGHSHSLLMHSLITGWPLVDHEDRDGLNNQRYNLREATGQQNHFNRPGDVDTSSQYKGVFWNPRKRYWHANIMASGEPFSLGSFLSETEAAIAYDAAASEKHGAFAYLNFPEGVTPALLETVRAEQVDAGIVHVCANCGRIFETRRRNKIHCSIECGRRAADSRARQRREAAREGERAGRLF